MVRKSDANHHHRIQPHLAFAFREAPLGSEVVYPAGNINATGVLAKGRLRRRSRFVGRVRFNGVGGIDPNRLLAIFNTVCECAESCVGKGQSKVPIDRRLPARQRCDYFLVVVRPAKSVT